MKSTEAETMTRVKVGIFTLVGLAIVGGVTFFVNDRPYWWRTCQFVKINVEDATGLKSKSAVRSLGLEIGYLKTVTLSETHVELGICITENVEVLPATRAYLRSEGFLGDRFVELKPVRYLGVSPDAPAVPNGGTPASPTSTSRRGTPSKPLLVPLVQALLDWPVSSAWAEEAQAAQSTTPAAEPAKPTAPQPGTGRRKSTPAPQRQIPVGGDGEDVQAMVKRVDTLVNEMSALTGNLKEALNPEELRTTMRQLNRTLENASRTLGPQGNLNQTAQRTLAKLEDAIEQMRDLMTRVNQGEGSVGMLLNDPAYAEEIRELIRNANKIVSKVNGMRFVVDIGGEKIQGYSNQGRGGFRLGIWPAKDRYYLIGIAFDPRGARTETTTEVCSSGTCSSSTASQTSPTGPLFTAMLGKVFFRRLDLSIGAYYGDGTASMNLLLGPRSNEEMLQFRSDVYARGGAGSVDGRLNLIAKVFMGAYLRVGLESFRKVNGLTAISYGAGVSFDDEDIKLLFAFK